MRHRILTGSVIKVFAAAAALLLFAAIIYSYSGIPSPREQDRVVVSGGGFSIIRPRGWEGKPLYGPPDSQYLVALDLRPAKSIDPYARISVARYRDPPDLDQLKSSGFEPIQFQNATALVKSTKNKFGNFLWKLVVQKSGGWYTVELALERPVEVSQSRWWDYITSFRAVPVGTSMPTTIAYPSNQ